VNAVRLSREWSIDRASAVPTRPRLTILKGVFADEAAMFDPELLEPIYDVVLGRSTWNEVLTRLRQQFRANAGLLIAYGDAPSAADRLCLSGGDDSAWHAYQAHYASIDPFAACMRGGRFPAGRVMSGDDVVPAKTLARTEFYNDWFRPHDIHYTAGAHVRSRTGRHILLGLPRAKRAGAYSPDELRCLQTYFDHIRRALEVQDALDAHTRATDFDRIAARHGLTAAEARIMRLLTETGSLKGAATRAGRSYYTARAQLRAVFQKTGTHSQVELMALIHGNGPDASCRQPQPSAASH
jgi:DNA-binding CsgD family transcriptional regulator